MSILSMDIRLQFGANLRRHRLAHGLSQEAVAERIGVDRAHVSSMERGLQNVTLLTLHDVAQALGIAPAELLDATIAPSASATKAPRKRRVVPAPRRG